MLLRLSRKSLILLRLPLSQRLPRSVRRRDVCSLRCSCSALKSYREISHANGLTMESAAGLGLEAEVESLKAQLAKLEVTLKQKEAELKLVHPYCKTYGKTALSTILGSPDKGRSLIGRTLRVGGWVKTGREAGAGTFTFLEVNDGSTFESLQVVVSKEVAEAAGTTLSKLSATGTSVLVEGELTAPPEGTKQAVELKASQLIHVGPSDAATYAIAKKKTSFEFLREKMHLRPRTNTIGVVARIRNALAFATHRFFQESGFLYVHTPIITASDCEGAGEMFQITTLLSKAEKEVGRPTPSPEKIEELKTTVVTLGEAVKAAKEAAAANKEDKSLAAHVKEAVAQLQKAKEEVVKAEDE